MITNGMNVMPIKELNFILILKIGIEIDIRFNKLLRIMKNRVGISIFVILTFLLWGCGETIYELSIQNNSHRNIYVYAGLGAKYNHFWFGYSYGTLYPDTTLPKGNYSVKALTGGGASLLYYSPWSAIYKELSTDTISFFVFDCDTVEAYPWDVICDEYKILKRYDSSYNDLKSLNYTIYYPPVYAMRRVKMYPPYGVNE